MLYGIKYKKLISQEDLYQKEYEVPFQKIKDNIDLIDKNAFTQLFIDQLYHQYRARCPKKLLEANIGILDTMKEIPDSMFNSIDIESIEIPNCIDDIDSDAFTDSDLRQITFQENSSVRRFGIRCFADTYIQKIILPDSLYHLDSYWFYNCSELHTIELNQNLQSIGAGCFSNCKSLSKLIFHGSKDVFNDIDKDDDWLENSYINYVDCDDGIIYL